MDGWVGGWRSSPFVFFLLFFFLELIKDFIHKAMHGEKGSLEGGSEDADEEVKGGEVPEWVFHVGEIRPFVEL